MEVVGVVLDYRVDGFEVVFVDGRVVVCGGGLCCFVCGVDYWDDDVECVVVEDLVDYGGLVLGDVHDWCGCGVV